MTYPDDVLIAGREAAAVLEERKGYPKFASRVRRGGLDYLPQVQSACIAIMAARQRCAERADKQNWPSAKRTKTGDVRSFLQGYCAACDDIKAAILDQQEAPNAS